MSERLMVTCPGCDGVVSVSPTGDEAEVRCLKCDEVVYTRNAEGGEWWANVPVADPTVEKPAAVPIVAPTTPEVPVPVVPKTPIVTPTRRTQSRSAVGCFLGGVLASLCFVLFVCVHYLLCIESYANAHPNSDGYPKDAYSKEIGEYGWILFFGFIIIWESCSHFVDKRLGRVSTEEAKKRNRAYNLALALVVVLFVVVPIILIVLMNTRATG